MISMVVLVGVMIALLATVHYVGILFLLALAPALFLISCCYGVGGTRQSVRINNLVRAYWLGLLFAIPVAVVEGVVVTKWWNAAGQPDYINWGPSRGMSLRWSIGAGFFVAFLIYGLFENTLKYIATRAYYNRAIFYTPFGLPLIGMAVALGFATVENLVFILLYGFVGAIIRGVIAVPFQAVIGLIIGTMLARHKWLTNQPDGVATQGKPGFGVYLKTILLTFILMGLFELPFMVILMRHKLYTYWAFWLLGSLPVLLASYIIYLVLSRPLRRATMTTS
jgi:RsiW-degrading membrane proteinase PrsW (M82 family)